MTNPPHDGDERDADPGGPQADPDQTLTQPVRPYGRPATPTAPPYGPPGPGQPGPGQPQPYGRPTPGPGYGPPPQQYGQQPPQPWRGYGQPPYDQPPYGQPAYGPTPYAPPGYGSQYGMPGQPYGPPQAGPPQKSKVGLIFGLTGLALLLVVGLVVAVLALQSTVLDPAAVERDVAAQFEQREGVAIDLTCPEDMAVNEGESYPCRGVTADGEEVTLQITITDEDTAAYTWTEP